MNRSLEYYLGVLRKHWLQILVIGVLTVLGGYLYYSRQVPVFKATVKLRIIRQQSRSAGDVSFTFEEDQVFYNTQYNLLRTQIDWAEMLLQRVAFRVLVRVGKGDAEKVLSRESRLTSAEIVSILDGPAGDDEFDLLDPAWEPESKDPAERKASRAERDRVLADVKRIRETVIVDKLELNGDAFLAGISATPIPGTHLAELSYEAIDPGVAVLLVNMYAELYRDVARGERQRSIDREVEFRERRAVALAESAKAARIERDRVVAEFGENPEFGHLNPHGEMNPFQVQAEAVATTLNEKQTELILREEEEERLREALREHGIEVVKEGEQEGSVRLRAVRSENGEAGLNLDLAGNLAILAQPVVEASENVSSLRRRVRQLVDERARLLGRFTPTSDEVKQADRYIETARKQLGAEVGATIGRFLRAGRDLGDVIEKLQERLAEKQRSARSLNENYATVARADENLERLEQELDRITRESQDLKNLSEEPSAGPLAIQNIRIERRARIKDTPRIRPNTMMIILLTMFAAVFLSFGSAFLVEFLDDTVKTKEDFERFVGVPDIGFIPRIGEKEFEKRDTAVLEKPRSGVAEAFRSIRTGILFSRRDEEVQRMLISSAGPGEGKTTIATNLAITMASAGRGKVLLIDADLRKARVHTALGVVNTGGLTNCLVGSGTLADAVRPTEVPNLDVLTAGPTPPNPAELLGGHRMAEILDEAAKDYGKIIIDTPPLVAVTDTCLLAPLVDGIFLVISMGKTSWRLIDRAKQSLSAVGEEVTGAIVNDVRSTGRGYGYGYGYGYGRYHRYYQGGEEE